MGMLRIILAITVVIAHSASLFGFKFTGGSVAVEVFFMISGFYMTMILNKRYVGKGSYTLFLSNRFLRLYPVYWTVVVLTIILSLFSFLLSGNWGALSPYVKYFNVMAFETLFFQIFTNLALFGQDVVMFLGMNQESGKMFFTSDFSASHPQFFTFLFVPQAWSLGIELIFYLIAPFIVRKSNLVIALLIISSMSLRIFTYVYLGYSNDPWADRFFPFELAWFLLGTISYRVYESRKIINYLGKRAQLFIVAIFFIILIFYQFIPTIRIFPHIINWSFYLVTCLALPLIFELSKTSKYDSRIGELSYPIYVSHMIIISFISPLMSHLKLGEYMGEITVSVTIIASYILIKFISDPIELIRQSRVKDYYGSSTRGPMVKNGI